MSVSHRYSDKWTRIGIHIEICLGNYQDKRQLHRFTRRENTAKSVGGYFFDSHCWKTYLILRIILSQTCLWTRKSSLNFGNYLDSWSVLQMQTPDPNWFYLGRGLYLLTVLILSNLS